MKFFTTMRIPRFIERLWALLPDECDVEGCSRQGVRGNENIIEGMIVCDYCSSKKMDGHELKVRRAV